MVPCGQGGGDAVFDAVGLSVEFGTECVEFTLDELIYEAAKGGDVKRHPLCCEADIVHGSQGISFPYARCLLINVSGKYESCMSIRTFTCGNEKAPHMAKAY